MNPLNDRQDRPLLVIRDLEKTYPVKGSRLTALSSINLQLATGEFCSVLGPSGCGKTTLLKIIAGLEEPTEGSIEIAGSHIRDSSSKMGVVYQQPVLYPWRTILKNVAIPGEILHIDRAARMKRAEELLALVGLRGFEARYPKQLSGGMQQRASLARALVHDPDFLLMDEPFGALDAMTREHMQLELLRIWTELHKTILFITHSIPEAILMSDKVVVMTPRPGRVATILEVDLPRPRTLDMINTSEFGAYVKRARSYLDEAIDEVVDV